MTVNDEKDRHNIQSRLEDQIDLILKEMEGNPELFALKERLSVVQIVGMFLTRTVKLNVPQENEPASATIATAATGSAVRKYIGAFKTHHATGGGKANTRPARAARARVPTRPATLFDDADGEDSAV